MERDILRTLHFTLVQPTSLTFLLRYLQVSLNGCGCQHDITNQQVDLLSKVSIINCNTI